MFSQEKSEICLYYSDSQLALVAQELAAIIPNSVAVECNNPSSSVGELFLCLQTDGLVIYTTGFKPFNLATFYSEFIKKRRASLSRENLIQAINLHPNKSVQPISILDLTAGLGRDSMLLSLYGYQVTMLENNPYLAIILNYLCHTFKTQLAELKIIYTHNYDYLYSTTEDFDAIYWDPMFADNKQALAKKDMQLIDLFINKATNTEQVENAVLFDLIRSHCLHKLIVKRDNKQANLLTNPKPTYSKTGKTIRFDIYQM